MGDGICANARGDVCEKKRAMGGMARKNCGGEWSGTVGTVSTGGER